MTLVGSEGVMWACPEHWTSLLHMLAEEGLDLWDFVHVQHLVLVAEQLPGTSLN